MCSYKFQSKQHLLWENKWFSEKQLPRVLEEFLTNTKTWAFILKLNILNNYEMRLLRLSESRTEREKVEEYNIKYDICSRTITQQHNNKLKRIFHWNQRDNPSEVEASDGIARLCLLCPHLLKTLWMYSPSQLKRLRPGTWQFLNVSLYRPWPWPFQWQERNLKMSCSICRFYVSGEKLALTTCVLL